MASRFAASFATALVLAAGVGGCASYLANPPRNDELFTQIVPGMPQDEVRARLGPPDETMPFPMSRTMSWDYRYYDTWGYICFMSITFGPDQRVQSKISRRINSGADHSSR